jgi:hypothetical protein
MSLGVIWIRPNDTASSYSVRMIKTLAISAVLLLLSLMPLLAQGFPTSNGQVYESVQVDLDGDGTAEEVRLRSYGLTADEEFYGQLEVADLDGNVLWKGPQADNPFHAYAFGGWHIGFSGLDLVGDFDADGTVHLLSAAPISDVRPPTYRLFAWNGSEFVAQGARALVESPANSGRYRWTSDDSLKPGRFVNSFEGFMADGTVIANITQFVSNTRVLHGRARVKADDIGFHVVRWEEAPR